MMRLKGIIDQLGGDKELCSNSLNLKLGSLRLALCSNSDELLQAMADYFDFLPCFDGPAERTMLAIQGQAVELDSRFTPWPREPGKSGLKDEYINLDAGRLIRKHRSGMLFLQSEETLIASGPCLDHQSQLINFVNSQHMNSLQHAGQLICHAAAVAKHDQGLMLAGLSGGGKSSLMLHLMEDDAVNFISNDRVFVSADPVFAHGIPKLPRINPGTVLSLTRLHVLASQQQLNTWQAMPSHELWTLEQKHDVPVGRLYGPQRIQHKAPLKNLLILNWHPSSSEDTQIREVDLNTRPELIAAVRKSQGPFFQDADGQFLQDATPPDDGLYQDLLATVRVHEACGRVNFDQARVYAQELLAA